MIFLSLQKYSLQETPTTATNELKTLKTRTMRLTGFVKIN